MIASGVHTAIVATDRPLVGGLRALRFESKRNETKRNDPTVHYTQIREAP